MFHKGLTKSILVETTKELIAKEGYSNFSMRQLADALGVKTASLYTHTESMGALITDAGLSILEDQKGFLLDSICGKHRDEAVWALAYASVRFAKEHREFYKLIMQMPAGTNETLRTAAEAVTEPFMQVLSEYKLTDEQKMHWQRVLRGIIHGFISQEQCGYFSHYSVDLKTSYDIAIQCFIDGLHHAEEGEKDE